MLISHIRIQTLRSDLGPLFLYHPWHRIIVQKIFIEQMNGIFVLTLRMKDEHKVEVIHLCATGASF